RIFGARNKKSEKLREKWSTWQLCGKLLLLEELRVAKDSQTANLQKVEEALEAKNAAVRERTRDEEIAEVSRLLKSRETFHDLLGDLREQWKQAFLLRLPVYTKNNLDENVRLRSLCNETTQALLTAQDENRSIRKREKALDVELEMQDRSEKRAKVLSAHYKEKFSSLDSRIKELQQEQSSAIEVNDFEMLSSEIQESESAMSNIQDKLQEMNLVLKDQEEYRETLKHRLDKVIDQNDILVSNILRTEQVLKARETLVKNTASETVGYETLHQIKIFLDLAEQFNNLAEV
ncbi:uncharacterized protein LOC129225695, partial [Uloborus diversus]|uniref:uncharacterized protein LOC129225695 n=1 Tax=Uloborus diversus TaxID=327109 RepID=UPI00240A33D5